MLLLALLATQAAGAAEPAPDIELNVHATVREVRIRQRGEASLQVRASPDANSRVSVARPASDRRPGGRNATVDIHAEARIAGPGTNSQAPATENPN
jgi:hypothetical protein